MARLRVLAIAESAAGAEVLRARLERCGRLDVREVIAVDSGALADYPGERPEVAVVEVEREGARGLACIAELAALAIPVVAILSDMERVAECWDAGVRGLVFAPAVDAWQAVIEVVADGGVGMAEDLVAAIYFKDTAAEALFRSLTEREVEVLGLVARGRSNDKIALALGISKAGVDYHMRMIYEKLGVRNRAAAVAMAMGSGPARWTAGLSVLLSPLYPYVYVNS